MAEYISRLGGRDHFKPIGFRDVTLKARLPRNLLQVGAWPESMEAIAKEFISMAGDSFSTRPGGSIATDDLIVMMIAPGSFLVEGEEPDIADGLLEIVSPDLGTVTDLTGARVALSVAGTGAERVLSRGLAIDLTQEEFPVRSVAQSAIGEIGLIMRRVHLQEFELYVYRSFANALWDWLKEASNCD